MRLAVISDIHGNVAALEAVLNDLKAAGGADKTWVLGDLLAFGPRPMETLQMIQALPETSVISGNHERHMLMGTRPAIPRAKDDAEFQARRIECRERDRNYDWSFSKLSFADYEYLIKLRPEIDLDVPDYGWIIGYHGAPGNDEALLLPTTPDEEAFDQMIDREGRLGIGGHTHRAMDRELGRWRLVNPGSVGMPQDAISASYALITFENGAAQVDLRRVAYDMDAVIADLEHSGNPSWQFMVQVLRRVVATPQDI